MDPAGKVALVTGSGLGIGRGIAAVLAQAGASVVVNDIDEPNGFDILVNNAGAGDPPGFPVAHAERWNAIIDVYLRAPMATIQYALPLLEQREGGVVVNISSMAGVGYGAHWWPEYAASKAAIIRLTAALASLAGQRNVRVNCVAPNWVATEKVLATVARMSPEQRKDNYVPDELATPEDIGEVVLEFVRDDSLAGRIIHHYAHGERKLIPTDVEY